MDRETLLTGSPSQIFDGALASRRSLRKAYAELIRRYGPERDPECFRRIRDAYEELSAHFEAPAPTPVMVEAPARAGHAAPEDAEDAASVLDRCRHLLDQQRSREALDLLDRNEARLRVEDAQAWFRVMMSALSAACDEVPPSRITRAFDDLDDPRFQIDEDAYFDIAARWMTAQAWAAARHDQALPAVFRDALGNARGATRLAQARRWHAVVSQLGERAFVDAYWHIVLVHPGLLPELYRIENQITGVDDFTRRWEFSVPELEVPPELAEEVKRLRALRHLVMVPSLASRKLQTPVGLGLILAFMASFLLPEAWQATSIALVVVAAAVLAALHQRSISPLATARRLAELERRTRALLSTSQLFRHELLALLVEQRQPEHVAVGEGFFNPGLLDPLTTIAELPPTELSLLSTAHLARIERTLPKDVVPVSA